MSIVVDCAHCGNKLKVADKYVGHQVKCPHCGRTLTIADSEGDREVNSSRRKTSPGYPDVAVTDEELLPSAADPTRRRGRGEKYCFECGAIIRSRAVICPKCGVEQSDDSGPFRGLDSNRVAAGLCGILIGGLGIHKFILGLTGPGLTMLLITVCSMFGGIAFAFLTCGLGAPVIVLGPMTMHVIGLIEGIIYLSKTDDQFYRDYIVNKKGWF